ncbi:MAG: hypothetical protein JXR73_11890 [Candidatus Omnitrophica bacterium]|nr:hypothetical protein [Candidatus Omnitrophota bacterium]
MKNPMIFCAAIPNEIKPLCRRLNLATPHAGSSLVKSAPSGDYPVQIAVSGVGRDRMEALLQEMSPDPVCCWVSIGFAGGLAGNLSTGDCLIGHNVMTGEGDAYSFDSFWRGKKSIGVSSNWLYCSRQAITSAEQKKHLHKTTEASLVDMESAAVARHAQKRKEPFAWIRVVSDAAGDDVAPEMMKCLSPAGFPSAFSALKIILAKPALLLAFLKMGRRSSLCASNLADVILLWMEKFSSK